MKSEDILRDTRTLQANLLDASERQVNTLLAMEMSRPHPRKLVVERVHQRLCILRGKREREELMRQLSSKEKR